MTPWASAVVPRYGRRPVSAGVHLDGPLGGDVRGPGLDGDEGAEDIPGSALVYFEKMDGTQTESVNVAIGKARSAALYKRPTQVLQDVVASGGAGLRILGLEGGVPIGGGVPLVVDGKIVGASASREGAPTRTASVRRRGRTR